MISLLCALSLLGCSDAALGAAPARDRAGLIHFARAADSSFDRFTQAPTPAQQAWMRSKYWRMRAYAPYFDSRTPWFGGAWAYKDAMAIYPGESKPAHWYLKDAARASGSTSGGAATARRARSSPVTSGRRSTAAAWIDDAKAMYLKGYKGLFVDDVNMSLRISDGAGNLKWPVDPRTGTTMTAENWRRYLAEFMEQLQRELPGAEIVHNSLWFDGDSDPYVRRQLDAADLIEIERGINDSGLRGGEGFWSVKTLFKFIDRLHARGKGVVLDASAPTHAERLYGLAGYFLISDGRDAMGNYQAGTPEDWWAGYDTDLGEALGARYDLAERRHPARLHARHRAAERARHLDADRVPGLRLSRPRRCRAVHGDAGPGHRRRAPAHLRHRAAGAGHPAAAGEDRDDDRPADRAERPDADRHPEPRPPPRRLRPLGRPDRVDLQQAAAAAGPPRRSPASAASA